MKLAELNKKPYQLADGCWYVIVAGKEFGPWPDKGAASAGYETERLRYQKREAATSMIPQSKVPIEFDDLPDPNDEFYNQVSAPTKKAKKKASGGNFTKCYSSHPVLKIGGGTLQGGSCGYPAKGADIYVGLDGHMAFQEPPYPWLQKSGGPIEVLFPITDTAAPKDEKNFVKMIAWLKERLAEGKKVHVGCMGGHGRTGMVIAALVKECMGIEDAIGWTRKNYCQKAVETKVQVQFLVQTFGIKSAEPSKGYESQHDWVGRGGSTLPALAPSWDGKTYLPPPLSTRPIECIPLTGSGWSIWGDKI